MVECEIDFSFCKSHGISIANVYRSLKQAMNSNRWYKTEDYLIWKRDHVIRAEDAHTSISTIIHQIADQFSQGDPGIFSKVHVRQYFTPIVIR